MELSMLMNPASKKAGKGKKKGKKSAAKRRPAKKTAARRPAHKSAARKSAAHKKSAARRPAKTARKGKSKSKARKNPRKAHRQTWLLPAWMRPVKHGKARHNPTAKKGARKGAKKGAAKKGVAKRGAAPTGLLKQVVNRVGEMDIRVKILERTSDATKARLGGIVDEMQREFGLRVPESKVKALQAKIKAERELAESRAQRDAGPQFTD